MEIKRNTYLFEEMKVGKAIRTLAVPTILSQIIVILYSVADSYFIGQTGDPFQLASLSIAFPIFSVLTAVANMFGIGANSLISRSLGKSDFDTVRKASSYAFWASAIVTVILSVALFFSMDPLLRLLGASDNTLGFCRDYLMWVFIFGSLPTVLSLTMGHLLRAEGHTKAASLGMALGGVLNIILDPIMIFTFHMDVAGAAAATMISNAVSFIFFAVVMYRVRHSSASSLRLKHLRLTGPISSEILKIGIPVAISVMLVCLSNSIMAKLCAGYNDYVVAAYNVTQKVGTVTVHISLGMTQGVMPLIGYNYSAGNYRRVRDINRTSLIALLIFAAAFFAVVELFAPGCVRLFIDDSDTIVIGQKFLRLWSFCVFGMCLHGMYNAIFQAFGKWKQSLAISILRLGVIFMILAFGLNALFGLTGLMLCQPITDTVSVLIGMMLYSGIKKRTLISTETEEITQSVSEIL